jgi:hypothetical protein
VECSSRRWIAGALISLCDILTAVGQLGALYVFVRYDLYTVAMDAADGAFVQALGDFGKTIYDLLLPHYGYYGGAVWVPESLAIRHSRSLEPS